MKTECPHCSQHYEVDDQYDGQVVECQSCHHEFVIVHRRAPSNVLHSIQQPDADKKEEPRSVDAETIWQQAKVFIEPHLKSPGSAIWPPVGEKVKISKLSTNYYQIKSFVDSQNEYGALIRSSVFVIMSTQNGRWVLNNIKIGEVPASWLIWEIIVGIIAILGLIGFITK